MGSGASLPEFIDPEQCKEIVGEANFNQEKFDSIKETNGKITAAQLTDLMLDSILAAPPSGKRNDDIAPLWDQMSTGWAQVPAMQMKIIELFRGSVDMLDQAPDIYLAQCAITEIQIKKKPCNVFIPKALEVIQDPRPVQIFYHGGGFIMGGPDNFKKTSAKLAVTSNSIVLCPTVGYAPENKAVEWLENAYAALKYVHSDEAEEKYYFDKARVAIRGESHGGYTALTVAREAAKLDEPNLIKFVWLDIPAITNDFVPKWKEPETEVQDMHKACSKLHMQTIALLFTDPDKVEEFNWDENKENAEAFPALMDDETLAKLPPVLITTGEFDHVGKRGSEQFAERLKTVEGKLLACYVQPGVMHGVYGAEGRKLRDIAERLLYSKFL